MRILIAPDSFKGSLDPVAVATALRDGWQRHIKPAKHYAKPVTRGFSMPSTVRQHSRSRCPSTGWSR